MSSPQQPGDKRSALEAAALRTPGEAAPEGAAGETPAAGDGGGGLRAWLRAWYARFRDRRAVVGGPSGAPGPGDSEEPAPPSPLRRILQRLVPGRVSRIHLYEAQERWWSLKRMVEFECSLRLEACDESTERPGPPEGELRRRQAALVLSRRILSRDYLLLTRRQRDLNRLWRSLNRVRILLLQHVFSDDTLIAQLDFCREEAVRLRVEDTPSVKNLMERIAKGLDEEAEELSPKQRRSLKRAVRAAYEHLNTIRTSRILQQYMNVRSYQYALLFLIPISLLLLTNHRVILKNWQDGAAESAQEEAVPPTEAAEAPLPPGLTGEESGTSPGGSGPAPGGEAGEGAPGLGKSPPEKPAGGGFLGLIRRLGGAVAGWVAAFANRIRGCLERNVLAFVYFGGLAGGFFSAVMRLRGREEIPGDDVYFVWYVLTKPFVGAVGAVMLYILLVGGFVDLELIGELKSIEPDSRIFGFAILAGFSERIAFPALR